MRRNAARRLRGGGVFIITVGVLASLVAILAAAAASQQVALMAASNRMQATRAKLAAEAGLQFGLAHLVNQDLNQTLQQDEWFTLGNVGSEEYTVGAQTFRIQIVDAAGRINLNTATQEQLERLPLSAEQIASILDWREGQTTPRPDGAKDEYYNGLSVPYNAKLRRFDTIDELLLVKGFTARSIYDAPDDTVRPIQPLPQREDGSDYSLYELATVDSVSGNTSANGQQKPNISSANVNQLIQLGLTQQQAQAILNPPPTSYAQLLQRTPNVQVARQLVNRYSVSNAQTLTGKINLNTASEAVLASVPNLPPDIAGAIVTRQSTGFVDIGDLFDVAGYSLEIARQTLDAFATSSRSFLVRVVGTAGSARVSLEALVTLAADGPRITRIENLPYPNMSARWLWPEAATTQITLKEYAE